MEKKFQIFKHFLTIGFVILQLTSSAQNYFEVTVRVDSPPSCNMSNGVYTAVVTGTGGVPPYKYSWLYGQTTQTITNASRGSVTVKVTDANGKEALAGVYQDGTLDVQVVANGNCLGQDNGQIRVTNILGGSAYYDITYYSNGSTFFGFSDGGRQPGVDYHVVQNLPPGTYEINVHDRMTNCKGYTTTTVVPFELSVSHIDIATSGVNNGSATATITGGTMPYNLVWQGPAGFSSTNLVVNNLAPGAYSVQASDSKNPACIDNDTVVIDSPTFPLRNPENPVNTQQGIMYSYFEGVNWQVIPNFDNLNSLKSGVTSSFNLWLKNRDDNFGFRYDGFVEVPTDGTYTFYTSSDDGSKLYIGSTLVVDNDGLHGNQERSGAISLKAGKHAIRVDFFENSVGEILEVKFEGPGITKQLIPANKLFTYPSISLRYPENPSNTINGVSYKYFEGNDWSVIPNFANLSPAKNGTTPNYSLTERSRNDNFGFAFDGFIEIPTDGTYTFYTSSDDGSKLYIGSTLVVDNDGLHGNQERSGAIGLKAGKHAIRVDFFEKSGGEILEVKFEGPGITKQLIPANRLFTYPSISLRYPENPSNTINGVSYKYFEGNDWSVIPNFANLSPAKNGTIPNYSLTERSRNDNFGFAFDGFIEVSTDGTYTFYTSSDDGSKLYIGSTLVVDNDGLHGNQERSGAIGLKAGKHAIRVDFFEKSVGEILEVKFEGPGITKQLIPANRLFINSPLVLRNPENPINLFSGLSFKYFEGYNWAVLPTFENFTPIKTGSTDNISLAERLRQDNFGFSFDGYIDVPTNGSYTFYTSSDDGSKLYIGSTLVVNNDGLHANQEKSGVIGLKAGKHAFKVDFFERNVGEILEVRLEGPSLTKQLITAEMLYRVALVSPTDAGNKISLYPNPAVDYVTIKSENDEIINEVSIANIYGIEVTKQTFNSSDATLSVKGLNTGLYILKVTTATSNYTKSFKIEK